MGKALLVQDFLKAEEEREKEYLNLFPWHKNWKKDRYKTGGDGNVPNSQIDN